MKYKEYNDFIERILREAGTILQTGFEKQHTIEFKGDIDLVTEIDKLSEEYLISEIRKNYPSHKIYSEESVRDAVDAPVLWLIDPLDGTTNYSHNYPFFSVTVALVINGEVVAGGVYAPFTDELFLASKGDGAYLNGRKIEVSKVAPLKKSLLITGFPYNFPATQCNMMEFNSFLVATQGVRRDGSAALDLCLVAAGRADGFWEPSLNPWDCAAGFLLVEEAGGKVTDYKGIHFSPFVKTIVASNGKIHEEMLQVIGCV